MFISTQTQKAFSFLALLAATSCGSPTTSPAVATAPAPAAQATDTLQQAVAAYIKANASSFVGYEPVRWGSPSKYTKMNEAAIKGVVAMQVFDAALVPRNKALADYKASLVRHDKPAKTEAIKSVYGKANKYNDSLLVIANSFIGVKDTTRLGTAIVHTYRAKDKLGKTVLDSASFVIYPSGKVEQL